MQKNTEKIAAHIEDNDHCCVPRLKTVSSIEGTRNNLNNNVLNLTDEPMSSSH